MNAADFLAMVQQEVDELDDNIDISPTVPVNFDNSDSEINLDLNHPHRNLDLNHPSLDANGFNNDVDDSGQDLLDSEETMISHNEHNDNLNNVNNVTNNNIMFNVNENNLLSSEGPINFGDDFDILETGLNSTGHLDPEEISSMNTDDVNIPIIQSTNFQDSDGSLEFPPVFFGKTPVEEEVREFPSSPSLRSPLELQSVDIASGNIKTCSDSSVLNLGPKHPCMNLLSDDFQKQLESELVQGLDGVDSDNNNNNNNNVIMNLDHSVDGIEKLNCMDQQSSIDRESDSEISRTQSINNNIVNRPGPSSINNMVNNNVVQGNLDENLRHHHQNFQGTRRRSTASGGIDMADLDAVINNLYNTSAGPTESNKDIRIIHLRDSEEDDSCDIGIAASTKNLLKTKLSSLDLENLDNATPNLEKVLDLAAVESSLNLSNNLKSPALKPF